MSESIKVIKKKYLNALKRDPITIISQLLTNTNNLPLLEKQRNSVENDSNYLQIIPYVVLADYKFQNNGDAWVLSYKRRGTEERLYDNYSIGFGGHWKSSQIPHG